ncbi:MAG: Gfo/Idh/MocA family oxidoreductase [Thermoguttaceae bacterium]|nr:Gfo/Idh/MocA family oxidoreductase [Thermoguttaceae bacterium]
MASTRRDFFRNALGLSALALAANAYGSEKNLRDDVEETKLIMKDRRSAFNMREYAAPAISNIRVGYIGMGNRGFASMKRLAQFEGVEIKAIADCYEYPIDRARQWLKSVDYPAPDEYFRDENSWRELIERDDLDLIYVTTPQYLHAEMASAVMEAGKHAACEVPLGYTLADCWKLVETSERTKKYCGILENCCFDFFESLTINMALRGALGELVYGEGAYIHYFPAETIFEEPMPPLSKKGGYYRFAVGALNKGNRYPTHGFGPVCQAMRINAGDKPNFLTSVETDDFSTGHVFEEILARGSEYHKQFAGASFTGNMNTSLVRTEKGKVIKIQYDRVSPRPYSRIHMLSGTQGFVQKYPEPARIYLEHDRPLDEEEMKEIEKEYSPELIQFLAENAVKFGGHGGMDFICDYQLIDSLHNGLPLNISVYEGATWSAVTPLSLWSVTHGSQPIEFPDFTGGSWATNKPFDLSLRGGGTTKVTPREPKE